MKIKDAFSPSEKFDTSYAQSINYRIRVYDTGTLFLFHPM